MTANSAAFLNIIECYTSLQNGLNALHLTSKEGHIKIVEELLSRGANIEAATKVFYNENNTGFKYLKALKIGGRFLFVTTCLSD